MFYNHLIYPSILIDECMCVCVCVCVCVCCSGTALVTSGTYDRGSISQGNITQLRVRVEL